MNRKHALTTILVAALTATAGATGGALLGDNAEASAYSADHVALVAARADLAATKAKLASSNADLSDARATIADYKLAEAEKTSGFHDAERLARSIKRERNKKMDKDGFSLRVDDTSCIAENDANTKFTCLVEWSDGTDINHEVTVATDGSSWILKGAE